MSTNINNQMGTQLENLSEQIEEGLQSGHFDLAEIQKMVMEKSKEAARCTDEYVHDNPWTSIGIAAGLGVVIGYLVSRR